MHSTGRRGSKGRHGLRRGQRVVVVLIGGRWGPMALGSVRRVAASTWRLRRWLIGEDTGGRSVGRQRMLARRERGGVSRLIEGGYRRVTRLAVELHWSPPRLIRRRRGAKHPQRRRQARRPLRTAIQLF